MPHDVQIPDRDLECSAWNEGRSIGDLRASGSKRSITEIRLGERSASVSMLCDDGARPEDVYDSLRGFEWEKDNTIDISPSHISRLWEELCRTSGLRCWQSNIQTDKGLI